MRLAQEMLMSVRQEIHPLTTLVQTEIQYITNYWMDGHEGLVHDHLST